MNQSTITFVTAFMNVYQTPFQNKDVEFTYFKKIAETGIQLAVFCCPDCSEYMNELIREFPNIKIIEYMNLQDTWTYKTCDEVEARLGEPLTLPNTRNFEKDTREHIILINTKTEYMKMAIEKNVWSSTHFAWIDFNIYHIFQGVEREQYVLEFLKSMSQRTMHPYFLTLPGCWEKKNVREEFLINDICWRFCGGFFIGSADRVLEFHKCYLDYFADFLLSTKKLIWEVNFWAYLELKHGLSVIWYPADHNESILEISVKNMSMRISDLPSCQHIKYEYPDCGDYIPTSTAYLNYKGLDIINTRFVNYWLYPNGGYWIKDPDGYIRTRNFYSPLDGETLLPREFKEVQESKSGLKCFSGHIYGLEDIRLYEKGGDIHFIATSINYSGLGKNRMVKGRYDVTSEDITSSNITSVSSNIYLADAEVLIPPDVNSWCEKNWIPLANFYGGERTNDETNSNDEYFIYKWNPLEIGVLCSHETNSEKEKEKEKEKQLKIVKTWKHNAPLFKNVRGSTPLVECDEGLLNKGLNKGLICVVHFSYEGGPRNYFHMLVLLEKKTLMPLKYSEFFFFNNMSVEFCIGFTIRNEKYHFWISNFDREPELIIVDIVEIPLLFDFFI
jgi:hypothetical protein